MPGTSLILLLAAWTLPPDEPRVVDEVRDDENRPPCRTVFPPGAPIAPRFHVNHGSRGFADVWLNGGETPQRIDAKLVQRLPETDLVEAALPAGKEGDVLEYTLAAVQAGRTAWREGPRAVCFISRSPVRLSDVADNPKPYKSKMTPSPTDWRDRSIYFLMIDRFSDGDATNNRLGYSGFDRAANFGAHGGDFRGLSQKLDYIRDLGASAIWVTPILQNYGAYHGYGAVNFLLPDRRLGTLDDFRRFIDEAHKREIAVILDIICNHQGDLIGPGNGEFSFTRTEREEEFFYRMNRDKVLPVPHEFRSLDLFHHFGNIDDWNDSAQALVGSFAGLDDFRTELPEIRRAMQEIYKYWIAQTDVDGFRVDTVKHVDREFWTGFCPEIRRYAASIGKKNFYLCGELWSGDDVQVAPYTGTRMGGPFLFDGMAHFPMFETLRDVFSDGKPTNLLTRRADAAALYHDDALNVVFFDNHDVPRFLHGKGADGIDRLKLALAFLYTARGIPCLYYGTEQGFSGGADPSNREDLFDNPEWEGDSGPADGDNFNSGHELYRWISSLNRIRSQREPLRRGSCVARYEEGRGAGLYAFSRITETEELLVVLNTSDQPRTAAEIPLDRRKTPPGTVLVDLLEGKEGLRVAPGRSEVSVALPPFGARIYARR